MISDTGFPRPHVYQVCRTLRADADFQDTTIIMVSAKQMVAERYEGHESGADDYITKPFTEEEFLESIAFFLEKLDSPEIITAHK